MTSHPLYTDGRTDRTNVKVLMMMCVRLSAYVRFAVQKRTTSNHTHTHTHTHTHSLQHIRSLGIGSDDMIGEEKGKKKEYKFFVKRADGRYIFKVRHVHTLKSKTTIFEAHNFRDLAVLSISRKYIS